MRAAHEMRFGASVLDGGGVRFALWAPSQSAVAVERVEGGTRCGDLRPMHRHADGWHECIWDEAEAGMHYRFRIDGDRVMPDPASRCNPLGVHGPSEVVEPLAHEWTDTGWAGLPWHEATVYELHVGCFTPQGSFDAAALRLPYLRELGIRAIELMPLAAFAGRRGWGYDGVLPFAVHAAYGSPQQLKRFVEAAHRHGLMVLLDVVYNHFGPDGNYLHGCCPEFHDPTRTTPWGPALNLDGPDSATVRRFFIDNALYWVEEFRFDGLRLDAVHAIRDRSSGHLVEEIAAALRDGPGRQRQVHLVLENDDNNARWLARSAGGAPAVASAQWNDDWHHAAHVLATDEREGYYADYAQAPADRLAQALAEGFVYQGQASAHRGGESRGTPSAHLPSPAFVAFLQNHDQIGNRALGERLDALCDTSRVELLLSCLLLSPQVPMLFMGEEFAAATPFLYFCDFEGELADAVRRGRRQEFSAWAGFRDEAQRERIPDPNAQSTFSASCLRWDDADRVPGRQRLALVRRLLALRERHLLPHLPAQRHGGRWQAHALGFTVDWPLGDAWRWRMRASFGGNAEHWRLEPDETEIYSAGGSACAGASGERLQVTLQRRSAA